jgi:hypothetical protein
MRAFCILVVAVTLLGCASREGAYRRSLAAGHLSDFARDLPRSDFEQIAEVLSRRTRQSITDIQRYSGDQVIVYTAFPGAEGPGLSSQFILAKRGGRWQVVESRNETVVE